MRESKEQKTGAGSGGGRVSEQEVPGKARAGGGGQAAGGAATEPPVVSASLEHEEDEPSAPKGSAAGRDKAGR